MGIVFAAKVNGKLAAGDYAGAVQSSKQAKMWCWIGFGIGLVQWLLVIAYFAFVAAVVSSANHAPHMPLR